MKKKTQLFYFALVSVALTPFLLNSCGSSAKKITFYVDDTVVQVIETKGNESIQLPTTPEKDGYYFIGWYYNDQQFLGDEFADSVLNENISVYAQYKKYIHVNYVMNGGAYVGSGQPNELPNGDLPDEYLKEGESLKYGDTLISKEDYAFGGWYTSASFEGESIQMPYYPTTDVTLYACWAPAEVTLDNGLTLVYQYSEYNDVLKGYMVLSYNGTEEHLDIPASYKGIPIVEINNKVFERKATLKSVVTHNNLIKIGNNAFDSCSNLTSFVIADTVTEIGDFAFYFSRNLADITIGKGLVNIGRNAFVATQWYYSLPEGNNYVNNTYLVYRGNYPKEVTIKEGTTNIADYAFYQNGNLKSVTLPQTLKTIGDGVFRECKKLTEIILPNNLETIENNAFRQSGLKGITIPDSVTYIGENAFNNCKSLKTVHFGKGLKEIAYGSFSNTIIEEVDIPENVEEYGYAFGDCDLLTKMTIRNPKACSINFPANLKTVYVPSESLADFKAKNEGYEDRFFPIA